MNRRSFLTALGLAPVMPVAAAAAPRTDPVFTPIYSSIGPRPVGELSVNVTIPTRDEIRALISEGTQRAIRSHEKTMISVVSDWQARKG